MGAMRASVVALALGATALTTSSNRLPSAPRRTPTTASLKMEDFGLLKGTVFDYGREWTKSGMTEQQKGSLEDCMSEATMEKYMNEIGHDGAAEGLAGGLHVRGHHGE